MRMLRAEQYKLIYHPVGNQFHLFDLETDPRECVDLAGQASHAEVQQRLTRLLIDELYGEDLKWLKDGQLVGLPDEEYVPAPDRTLRNQRGLRFM